LAIAGTLGIMGLLKLLVFVVVSQQFGNGLNNPSGHTASGIVVYAGLLALVGGRFAPRMFIALLASLVFGLLFGFSRIKLQVHTLADVLVGGAVGLGGALVLAWLAGPRRTDARAAGMPVIAAVALAAILAFHGQRLIAESELRAIAAHIQSVADRAFN
jgi:membrane-associated phospholipid phosphatase